MRQEGRGIGLLNKLRAYGAPGPGKDTVEATTSWASRRLRHYGIGAQILVIWAEAPAHLTNNPKKIVGMGLRPPGGRASAHREFRPPRANQALPHDKRQKMATLFFLPD